MYITYIIIINQVICDNLRWKGPSDRNTLNIINSNVMPSPYWWQIIEVNVVQIVFLWLTEDLWLTTDYFFG